MAATAKLCMFTSGTYINSMVWGFPGASRRSPGTVFGRIGGVFRSLGQKTVRKGWLPELFFVSGVTLQRAPGGPGNLTSSPEIYTYRDRRARLTAGFLRPHVLLTRSHRRRRNSPFLELSCFGWATLPKAFGFRNATMDRHCRLVGGASSCFLRPFVLGHLGNVLMVIW